MGPERCVPTYFVLGTPGSASTTGWEIPVKCCGVAVVMPQGPSRAPPSSSEITVNTGTVLVLPRLVAHSSAPKKNSRRLQDLIGPARPANYERPLSFDHEFVGLD